MATDETVIIECDECGATFSPPEPTKSIEEARKEAAENHWSHVLHPFEVDWCPDCTITKINSTTCANYAKCKKSGFCHQSCWTPKAETTENKIFRLERVNDDKRVTISRLTAENAHYRERITELEQVSRIKDKALDGIEAEKKELEALVNEKVNFINEADSQLKAIKDVIKKRADEDVVYVKWIRNALEDARKIPGKKGCPKCEGGPCNGGGLGPCGCYVCDHKFGDKACFKCHSIGEHENKVLREMGVADGKKARMKSDRLNEIKGMIAPSRPQDGWVNGALWDLVNEVDRAWAEIDDLYKINFKQEGILDSRAKVMKSLENQRPRVEVDKNGVVEYCEYADDCPHAIRDANPKPDGKGDPPVRCFKCHGIIDKTKPNRVIQQWVGGHLKKRHEHEVCPPRKPDETYYECFKCDWTGPESALYIEETSGNAYCPNCMKECKKIKNNKKKKKCLDCDGTGWKRDSRDGIKVPCECPAGTKIIIEQKWHVPGRKKGRGGRPKKKGQKKAK